MSASIAFLGRCCRRLRTKAAAWTPCGFWGTVLVLRKDKFKVNTTLSFRDQDPASLAAVVDTGAEPSVVSEDLLPPGRRAHAWRAPTRTRIVDASRKALKALARVPLTLHVHDQLTYFPFNVVKRHLVPIITGRDFQRQYTKAILPQDGKIEWSTGAVSDILGYHLGARGRQYKALAKPRVRPNELTLAGATVLPFGAQAEIQVVTRSTGGCLIKGRAEFLSKHGLHSAHGHHKKVHRHESFSVVLVNLGRETKRFAEGTRVAVAEPYTGEARILSQGALLVVQHEIAARLELETQAAMATAEGPPEPPVVPPPKDSETPEEDWAGVPKDLHGRVHGLLDQFKGMMLKKLGELKTTTHHIQLKPDAKHVYSALYRAGRHRRLEIENQVEEMLDLGVVQPSDAEWAFLVVVVPTPGRHFRFFEDCWWLNECTVRDAYPIPRIDDCRDSLGDATVFSTQDCNTRYSKIPLAAEDRAKTTLTSHTGSCRFLRLPFGLVNAPASFQWALDILLSGLRWQTCLVYLDDVIVFSRTVGDHIWDLREVVPFLEAACVSLKPYKCHLLQQEFEDLGHVVPAGQLRLNKMNIKSLAQALPPRIQTELKSFLGMCNVCRRFIKDEAHIAKPLTKLTSKKLPHVLLPLDPAQPAAFEYLKGRLLSTTILALPRRAGLFILDTDACPVQVGCTLLQQKPDKSILPVGFYSRGLIPAEKNYSTTDRECRTVVWACFLLRPYLDRQEFLIRVKRAVQWVGALRFY